MRISCARGGGGCRRLSSVTIKVPAQGRSVRRTGRSVRRTERSVRSSWTHWGWTARYMGDSTDPRTAENALTAPARGAAARPSQQKCTQ
eukprot:gene11266-biopygen6580